MAASETEVNQQVMAMHKKLSDIEVELSQIVMGNGFKKNDLAKANRISQFLNDGQMEKINSVNAKIIPLMQTVQAMKPNFIAYAMLENGEQDAIRDMNALKAEYKLLLDDEKVNKALRKTKNLEVVKKGYQELSAMLPEHDIKPAAKR